MITASIVLHRTSPELISEVMQSLQSEPVDKIFIIDNSPDNSLQRVVGHFHNVEYHHIENRGFGNAHNFAIRLADNVNSDYHLILNPDVRWNKPILSRLVKVFESNENCALIQPRIVYPDGRLQHTCRLLPTPADVFAKRFLPSFAIKKRLKRYLLPDSAYEKPFNAVYMQGSFMLFRTKQLIETGLFDERFFMYPEDIDITRRIRKHHLALYYPDATVIHDHQAASSRVGKMLWIHVVNMCRYFNKWGWWHDPERRRLNKLLIKELGITKKMD